MNFCYCVSKSIDSFLSLNQEDQHKVYNTAQRKKISHEVSEARINISGVIKTDLMAVIND